MGVAKPDIVCATRNNAEILDMSDKIGTLEQGKLAEVIVVEGDPLQDITVLRDRKNILKIYMDEFISWPDRTTTDRIITAAPIDQDLEEILLRLLNIVGDPLKVKILGNSLLREVFFNILKGERG